MISDKVVVADKENECAGLETALEAVSKAAAYAGYGEADTRDLRQMASEMVAGSAAILNVFSGTLWAQTTGEQFQICLEMEGAFSQEERDNFVALTRDNKNTMPKGFFAHLGALIGDAMAGDYMYPVGAVGDPDAAEILWSNAEIAQMMAERDQRDPEDLAAEKTAKEVLDSMADDVQVAARANHVLITVSKALPKQ